MVTEPTNLRLDSDTKKKAYAIFEQAGLKPAQAINMFLHQVILHGGLPFEIKILNTKTAQAIKELASGKGKRYKNAQEMFDDLGI